MTRLHLTIRRKLFHHDQVEPLGTIEAVHSRKPEVLSLGKFNRLREDKLHPMDMLIMRRVIRSHVAEFLKDTRYCFLWNEDSGFETEVKML